MLSGIPLVLVRQMGPDVRVYSIDGASLVNLATLLSHEGYTTRECSFINRWNTEGKTVTHVDVERADATVLSQLLHNNIYTATTIGFVRELPR